MKIHSVKYNFVMNFILSVSSFVFPLITFPYVSRVLTAEGVGAVSFATSFVSYFTLVASLGIPTYGIRACAEVRESKEELHAVVQELFIINTISTFLVVVAYLALIQVVPRLCEDKILFYICGSSIILNALGSNWFFQALEQYDYITIRSLAFKTVSLILLFVLIHGYSDYILYAAISVFAAAGSCILNFFKMLRMGVFKKRKKLSLKRHMKPILILFAQSATASVYTNLDTVMLGLMCSNAEVGYYYVATQIKQIFLMLITSLANVLLPRMASYVAKKERETFLSTMATGINFSFLISLPVAFFFLAFSSDLILIFAGSGYQASALPTKILLFALVAIGLTQILGVQVLTPLKREKQVLISVVIGAMVDVCLNLMLIPFYGVVGVAASTLVAEIMVLMIQLYYARSLIKEVSAELHPCRYVIGSLISLGVCFAVYFALCDFGVVKVLVAGVVFIVVYFVFLKMVNDSFANAAVNMFQSLRKRFP